jgi:hypothetical protein
MPRKGFIQAQKKFTAKAKNSKLWKRLRSNKNISAALNKKYEEKVIYKKLRDLSEGGLYVNEVREFADRIAHGREKVEHIDWKEARQVAKGLQEELYPKLKRYKFSKPKPAGQNANISSENQFPHPQSERRNSPIPTNTNAGRASSFIRCKPKSVPPQTTGIQTKGVALLTPMGMAKIMNTIRESSTDSSENSEKPKGNFSSALAATMKNKRNQKT